VQSVANHIERCAMARAEMCYTLASEIPQWDMLKNNRHYDGEVHMHQFQQLSNVVPGKQCAAQVKVKLKKHPQAVREFRGSGQICLWILGSVSNGGHVTPQIARAGSVVLIVQVVADKRALRTRKNLSEMVLPLPWSAQIVKHEIEELTANAGPQVKFGGIEVVLGEELSGDPEPVFGLIDRPNN